jgi:mannose-6-phosphate isomerase-like protein (cupin superfamily)
MTLIKNSELSAEGSPTFIGADHDDVPISMFLVDSAPGEGPRLHRHPYAEVFVVHTGQGLFVLDDDEVTAGAGDVVIAPPGSVHRFEGVGEERLRLTAIHTAPAMQTEWLEPVAN